MINSEPAAPQPPARPYCMKTNLVVNRFPENLKISSLLPTRYREVLRQKLTTNLTNAVVARGNLKPPRVSSMLRAFTT